MAKASKATKKFIASKKLDKKLDQEKINKKDNEKFLKRRGNNYTKSKLLNKSKTLEQLQEDKFNKTKEGQIENREKEVTKKSRVNDEKLSQFFEDTSANIPKELQKPLVKKTAKESEDEESSEEDEDLDLDDLKEEDPEFYKYLEDNDKGLLELNDNVMDQYSGDDDSDSEEQTKSVLNEKIEVTYKMVNNWSVALNKISKKNPNLKLIKTIITAFKASINMNNEDVINDLKFTITDEKAFSKLMHLALKDLPNLIIEKLEPYTIKRLPNEQTTRILNPKTSGKVANVLKHHAANLIIMIQDINQDMKMASLILHSTSQLLPFFLSHRRTLKKLISAVIQNWATTKHLEIQITLFAFLFESCKEFKKTIMLENLLKSLYSSFIKNCATNSNNNLRTANLVNFQKNSMVEIFLLDSTLSYQIGFEYLRQLAIHLRNSINAQTNNNTNSKNKIDPANAYKIVYNWQFVHSLDFWSRFLSMACHSDAVIEQNSNMSELIYPLIQITIGTIKLIPTAQFFPLRFYLIKSLNRLIQSTKVYVPVYPLLQEILNSNIFKKQVKKEDKKLEPFDFQTNIKCNAQYLKTKTYQDGVIDQFIEILSEFMNCFSKSVSFPELSTPVIISLKRFIKVNSNNYKFNKKLNVVLDKIVKNNEFIESKREEVEFSPSNKAELNKFLIDLDWKLTPLGKYVSIEREIREERQKMLLAALEEEGDNEDVEEDEEEEVEEEESSDEE
ncbi:mRNA-binding ribosome synthesis protein [Hanseniaspora uvarum]|nr:mRNA-binding ribosome synthesis protein [Hanseniaspora uvarum]